MNTETTPLTDAKQQEIRNSCPLWFKEGDPVNIIPRTFAETLERSRRRNIQRAWNLRKEARSNRRAASYWKEWNSLFVEHFSSRFAERFDELTQQRDEAIAIAEDALCDGHRHPCYADERDPEIRCRCGWRNENSWLQDLKGEINEHGGLKTTEDCLDGSVGKTF